MNTVYSAPVPAAKPLRFALAFGPYGYAGYTRTSAAYRYAANDVIVWDQTRYAESVALMLAVQAVRPGIKYLAYQIMFCEDVYDVFNNGVGSEIMNSASGDASMFVPGLTITDPYMINARVYDFSSASFRSAMLAAVAALLAQTTPRFNGIFFDVCTTKFSDVDDGIFKLNGVTITNAQASALMSPTGLQTVLSAVRAAHPTTLIMTNSIEAWNDTNGNLAEDNSSGAGSNSLRTANLRHHAGMSLPHLSAWVRPNASTAGINIAADIQRAKSFGCALGYQNGSEYSIPPAVVF